MFRAIDDWIIDRVFQPVADWITETTGQDVFWAALASANIYLLASSIGRLIENGGQLDLSIAFYFCAWMLLLGSIAFYRMWARGGRKGANPVRPFLRPLRYILTPLNFATYALVLYSHVVMRLELLVFILETAALVGLFATLFLIACTTKPPKPKQERQPALAPVRT